MIGPTETRGVFGHAIDELRSPLAAFDVNSAPALASFGALAVLSLTALVLDRRFSLFDALVWFSFFALSLSAVRNIALFAVAAAPIFATHFSAGSTTPRAFPGRASVRSARHDRGARRHHRRRLAAWIARGPTVRAHRRVPPSRASGSRSAPSTGSSASARRDRSITAWATAAT